MALLLYYLPLISAISLPVSPQALSTNTISPNILPFNNNTTNLTAPNPPPGFSAQLKFNPSIQLKPLEVYICAVELLSVLSDMPWTSTLSLALEMSGYDASTELILNPFPPKGESRLQVRYAVLGLYRAGMAIAQGNKFYEMDAALYVGDEEVGWLEFRPKNRAVLEIVDVDYHSPALNASVANDTTTAMVTADSGTVWDPDDRNLALTFTWDGVRIKAQDIFTTFLESLATAAEHNNTDPDAHIPAARSASGDTVLSTWTLGEGGNAEMTWARLKRALIMMWDLLIVGQQGRKTRFEGLMFGLEYEGKKIGAGRMLRFDTGGEGGGGSAVEE